MGLEGDMHPRGKMAAVPPSPGNRDLDSRPHHARVPAHRPTREVRRSREWQMHGWRLRSRAWGRNVPTAHVSFGGGRQQVVGMKLEFLMM